MHLIERRAVRFATVVLAAVALLLRRGLRHHRRVRRPAGRRCRTKGSATSTSTSTPTAAATCCASRRPGLRATPPEEAQREGGRDRVDHLPPALRAAPASTSAARPSPWTAAQLEQAFGPRDPDLDDKAARGRHPQPRHRPAHRAGRRVRALRRPDHPDHRAGAPLREEEAGAATAAVGRPRRTRRAPATASRSTPSSTASRSSTASPSTRSPQPQPPPQQQPPGWGPPPGQQPPPPPSQLEPAQANSDPCGSSGSGGTKRSTPLHGRWSMNTQLRRWIAVGPMPRSASLWRGHG